MPVNDFLSYSNAPLQDYLQKSFVGNMVRYAPNGSSPLFAMLNMLGRGRTESVIHQYMSKEMIFPNVVLGAGVADGVATTFTVVSSANILPGDVLQVWSNTLSAGVEQVLVSAVPSATTLTVVRGFGTGAAAAITNGTTLHKVGNAFEQGSNRPAPLSINPVPVQNNTQIFRNSWALARTVSIIQPIVGDDLISENKQDAGMLHSADIEKALIFGQKFSGTRNNQNITKMSGVIESVRSIAGAGNFTVAGGTTNYTQLENALDPCFNKATNGKASNERVIFTGAQGLKVINNIGRLNGQYQLVEGATQFGLRFKSFNTTRGTFRLIEHPLFNSHANFAAMAIAVDLEALKVAYLKGVETSHTGYGMDGKAVENGQDAVGGTLLTECTLENINPYAHVVITNLTAAAAG